MRDQYHEDLAALEASLVEMTRLVGSAISHATQALLDADLQAAEGVIAGDRDVDVLYDQLELQAMDLLARQQPVARDLRAIVTGLRMMADLERAADYAVHVAEVARRRYPTSAIPAELHDTFGRMGAAAERLARKTGDVISTHSLDLAAEIERDDDEIDALHRDLFSALLGGGWAGGVEAAIDAILCGRYYERLADHLVSIGRRVTYLVTGKRYDRGTG